METIYLNLFVLLLAGLFGGWLAVRMRQPAISGELVVGAVLGWCAATFLPSWRVSGVETETLAHIGLCALLFSVGLEMRLDRILKVGPVALVVALIGILAPFAGGFTAASLLGLPQTMALFLGAALTATSVGITAHVLDEMGQSGSNSGTIILSAAVLDDIIGLLILAMVAATATQDHVSMVGLLGTLTLVLLFFCSAFFVLRPLARSFMDMIEKEYGEKGVCMSSFGLLLMLAFIATSIGLDLIIGAFAAGVALSEVREREQIHQNFKPFIHVFATLFFVIMGTHVDLSILNPMKQGNHAVFTLSMILIVIAIAGKILSGMVVPKDTGDKWVVGVGMIPRGEVGLVYANLGITSGILLREQFGALVLMVMVTTIVGPMVLRWVLRN